MIINLKKKYNASITVEAAFSFTLTVFILFLMLGPLLIIKTTSDVLIKLNDASKVRCNYEMIKKGFKDTKTMQKIKEYIDSVEFLSDNVKGIENIVNFGSMIVDFHDEYDDTKSEHRNIKLIYCKYPEVYNEETDEVLYDFVFDFMLPYNLLNVDDVRKRLVNNRRAFVGAVGDRFSLDESSDDFVYVANNHTYSKRYHIFIDCTYLEKDTESILYQDVKNRRNETNQKYVKCDYCFKKIKLKEDTTCYITEYGEKFHFRANCPLMTAYVTKLPKDMIDEYNLTLCSRCSKRESK